MKNKTYNIITIILVLLAMVAIVFSFSYYNIGEKYRTSLEYSYSMALADLTDGLENMETAIEKSEYSTTATMQYQIVCALISYGATTKASMAYLPFSTENASKFDNLISITEDYAYYLGKNLSTGETFTDEDIENLQMMEDYIKDLREGLLSIRAQINEEDLKIGKTETLLEYALNIPDTSSFDDSLVDISTELNSFPTVTYDGPFSDHITNQVAVFLEGKEEITMEEAVKIGADFLDVDESEVSCTGETEGIIAVYEIRGENLSVNVTKLGGEISWAKKSVEIEESKMTYEDALEEALEFLEESGITNVKESYYIINDNTCTINFSAVQDDVILYPDLIKIVIELNEGGVVEYEATGYLMNHQERDQVSPSITLSMAQSKISSSLSVEETSLAIIPSSGNYEILTYVFLCENDNSDKYLIYINAETGNEEQVYIIEEQENGMVIS